MSWLRRTKPPKLDLSVLEERRDRAFRSLGMVNEQVVSRLKPGYVPWPNSALGKLRIIHRQHDVLLITDGLSDPYDPQLHAKPPAGPLDFELCFSIQEDDVSAANDDSLAAGMWPKLLYALADVVVEEWTDIRGLLTKFQAITYQAPIGRGFGQGFENGGVVGYLLGMPIDGSDFNRQLYLNDFYAGLPVPYADAAVGIFPVKVLRPGELAWAMAQGNQGAMLLANQFIARGEGSHNNASLPTLHELPGTVTVTDAELEDPRVESITQHLISAVDERLRNAGHAVRSGEIELSADDDLAKMLRRVVKGGLSGEVPKGDDISPSELAALPLPPFPGATLKSFRRLPRLPEAFMSWVEGPGDLEQVTAHYLAAVQKHDPAATAQRDGTNVKIESKLLKAEVKIVVYEDETTVSAQVLYGAW